ncbi:MAG: trigger factor [Alphaproteobacteria bacterium]|nr:trigger factor [Alphaproteobacteria bacterium]
MQITETVNEGLKREFKVVIAASEIDDKVGAKLTAIAKEVRLPGFRPGKAPMNVVKSRFGNAALGEVLNEALQDSSVQALNERALKPAVQPKIDLVGEWKPGLDLQYTLAVEVLPEVVPGDFSAIEIEREVFEPDDAEVTESLDRLAEAQTSYAKVERAAAKGDAVLIDFVGKLNGVAFPGGAAKDHQLVLGSNSFVGTFEDQLIGAQAGDKKTLSVTFPEPYGNAELAGKTTEFEVDVKEVREAKKPAVDEDFAKSMGLENLEALKKTMRERIGRDYGALARNKLKRNLLDRLAAMHDFPVPGGMVELEFQQIWTQVDAERKRAGSEAAEAGKSEDEAKADYRVIAERRVRLGLLLSEVGRRNNIQVGQDEVNRAIAQQAARFPGQERQIYEYFQKTPEAQANLRAPLFEEKVVDFVLELAKVKDRKVSRDELLKDPEEAKA